MHSPRAVDRRGEASPLPLPTPTRASKGARVKIVVCMKHVPDATADQRFEADKTVDRGGGDGLLSELEECAVEQFLQVREVHPDGGEAVALRWATAGCRGATQSAADGC